MISTFSSLQAFLDYIHPFTRSQGYALVTMFSDIERGCIRPVCDHYGIPRNTRILQGFETPLRNDKIAHLNFVADILKI
jgi:hypothetical protein